ncbi:MAG: ABC transporter permease [Hungatella sp.]|jgi:hypothetical protein|nr:ABC transporter permease [Hungatella sp.]
MMALLEFREMLRSFYGKYDAVLTAVVKFAVSVTAFWMLNDSIGYMEKLKNPVVWLSMSLVCSFLPYSIISFLAGIVLVAHISSVSLELALILSLIFLMVAILYYGFQPGDGYLLLLTPLLFQFKIPYVIPLLVGLSGGLAGIVPVSCGVFVYYIIQYVKQNAGVLTNDAALDITQKYVQIIKNMMGNRVMVVMIIAFAAGILVVYLIRTLSVDYAWHIAIVAGAMTQLMVIFVGDFMFDVSVPMVEMLIGMIAAMILAAVYNFFVFAVDYSRTEYIQFQDDDYYYYVKAVPKITVSAPDVKVQKINSTRNRRREF